MKITIKYFIVFSLFLMNSCVTETDSNVQTEENTLIGKWRLNNVGGISADSIQSRQTLTLNKDSTYVSTFDLTAIHSRDTTRLGMPLTGKWSVMKNSGEYGSQSDLIMGISPDSVKYKILYYLSGGRTTKEMSFIGSEIKYNLLWKLIE